VDASGKVLIVGGSFSLFYGFLLGLPLTAARMKAPAASRHLVTAHLSAIIQGATLLALSGVLGFSDLPVRSLGWRLFAMSGPLNVAGAAAVLVGVLRGL
jgi:hypothetical protein